MTNNNAGKQPNFKNRTLWTADNLDVMRGIDTEVIDLIYIDPPFNSNRDYAAPIGSQAAGGAFKDTWTLDDIDTEHAAELQRLADLLLAPVRDDSGSSEADS